jgi:2-keto-4-pentenoate hydratase/2-oxohepta-3-ene-1,7-dioic acid hydratase in catechol pathway
MKLLVFSSPSGPRTGVVTGDGVLDVAELLGIGAPIRDVQELIDFAHPVADRITEALARPHSFRPIPLQDLHLLPPLRQPPSIRDHIAFEEHATRQFTREIAEVWRRRPIHYYSNPSRLVGPDEPVTIPATERLDYELEIAAVIAKEGSDLAEEQALDYIFGFTILNDWSARDLQADEMAYGLGPAKGKDFATSLGPWIVTTDELLPRLTEGVLDARCQVRVDGITWADSNSRAQFHTWGAMIEHASQDSRIVPGDIIASGTVGGCSIGEALRKGYPAHYLMPGDRVELEVDGIGILANTIAPNPSGRKARYRAAHLPPMPEPIQRS